MSKPLLMRLIVLGLACLSATSADAASIHRCYLPGVEDAAHCLTLTVPLDWKKPQGKTITVFAAQFPALSRGANKDPLFILPGGPGQSGDMLMPLVKSAFSDVNKARDLMLIYPRGTARSSPISCPEPPAFEVFNAVHVAKRLKACSAQQKNDPRFFTTDEITRDTNAIREAFGYTKLNIWGGSFGTRLAQHYIAAYPEQVRTVVLDGATKRGQSILLTMPHTLDVAINSVSISCKLDKACAAKGPDMRVTLRELLARLKAHPEKLKIDDPLTHEPVTITLDDNSVIDTLTLALYTPPSRAIIPIMVRMAARGNYQPLIALAAQAGSQLGDESISTGENLSVLCAEDFQQASRKDVEKSTKDSIFGLRNYDLYANACAA